MLLSPRGELYAKKLPELVRESVGVRFMPLPNYNLFILNVKLSHLPISEYENYVRCSTSADNELLG